MEKLKKEYKPNLPSNRDIASLLDVSERTVYNKRTHHTPWYLSEYMELVGCYGEEIAMMIVDYSKLIRD